MNTLDAVLAYAKSSVRTVGERVSLPLEQLAQIGSLDDAYRVCFHLSGGKPMQQVADECGIDYEVLARVLRKHTEGAGRRYMPHEAVVRFMVSCGNSVPVQWQMLQYRALTGVLPMPGGQSIQVSDALIMNARLDEIAADLRLLLAAAHINGDAASVSPETRPVWLMLELVEVEALLTGVRHG